MTRLFLAGHTAIRKEPLGRDAERRLRHEVAMLERLRGATGVAQLLDMPRYPGSVVLADGGTSLTGLATPLAVDDLVGLALELARVVAGMHRRGVMHQDISPANIVISRDGAPCLVDFALASSLAEIRPAFTHHTEIVGTLAYLAPEQTGRTGRSVDERADLYALGATLYELATGEPPFGSGDPLRLTHDHLARVPLPPAEVNPAVPRPLSAIIMHLLEKEPDNRYQTADGVAHDLERLRDTLARPAAAPVHVGEHDFPLRLLPPSRLVSREDEVAVLETAFAEALAGRCRGVLIGGAPGVGKTALVDQLRPVVTGADGWYVAGKFDQYRRALEFDAVHQAFRALGRLLLAEPEDELAEVCERIVKAVGLNAGLVTATSPEFATLLAVPPDPGDPLTAQPRAQRASVQMLRAIASRKRPVVLFLDDLQWAGRTALGFVDLVLGDEPIDGLLLVGTYREDDVDAGHPLTAPLSRWRDQATVRHLQLHNLPVRGMETMVAEMLHVDSGMAAGLVEVIEPYTSGNPYDTAELLTALRREGVLTATASGWRWDATTVRANLGRSEIGGLLAARLAIMPARSRAMVETMACLGARADIAVLQIATCEPANAVEDALDVALDEGLLVVEPGMHEAMRFRHDRIREVILEELDPRRRSTLQLAMARRLAAVPELFAVAAEQYLPVVDAVDDPGERRRAVGLLRRAAGQAALIGDYALVNVLLTAALRLVDPADAGTLIEVHTSRHAALFSVGRLEEADEEYRTIVELRPSTMERAAATGVQVRSLTFRNRYAEALSLGLAGLREFGIAVPAGERLTAELDGQFDYLYRWLDGAGDADDLTRPEITNPTLLATTRLLDAVLPAAYLFPDPTTHAWLSLEAVRIWLEYGPGRTLVGPAGIAAFGAVALRGDYAAGYRALRRVMALGEARGYEPDTSQTRFLFATLCWCFEPVENGVQQARRAREGLIGSGDLVYAIYSYHTTVRGMLDCAPSLDSVVAEVDAGLALVRRGGDEQTGATLDIYRWLVGVLRGETSAAVVPIDKYADNPLAILHGHISAAVAAAIFGDPVALAQHTAAAMPVLPADLGSYPTATAYLVRGLALASQVRTSHGTERDELLSELDDVIRWLATRAADAPDNLLHLLRLVEAERARAVGDFRAAVLAFDAARREAAGRQRPWHRALIAERAARFCLAHGIEHAGYELLAQARQEYLVWGAAAKVDQLDWAYPTLRPQERPSTVSTGTIDLLGILSASQELSSQTSIEGLHSYVVEVLSAMTGATGVRLVLWSDERQDWLLPAPDSAGGTALISGTGHEYTVPMSVLRYAQRIREPLVARDATRDDRFARDPYFADLAGCSLLAVPIVNRGMLRAVLLLENRLIRGAFSTERLDGVRLIAGQLAVSLDNAMVYASLERKVAERTEELGVTNELLRIANERLEQLSVTDPLTGVANRRRLEEVLDAEWQRAQAMASPISVAMIDIDHFKLFNDHYGHAAGDRCLQRVAAKVRQHVRDTDLVARYGGEEFAVVMPGMSLDAAVAAAERLRAAVMTLPEPRDRAGDRGITVSIGVATTIPPQRGTWNQLVESADAELYRAKRGGRNRVHAAPQR
ncbi:diguanylate cyclase [Phytohabitans rumicis]|uniref:diguanylate cyclase n=1 Tax=Phytohabitans rumicis TaxID=1076125 RepID=UPI001C49A845|nr:diguanylate cyclase [Phytohabitans rumicis]